MRAVDVSKSLDKKLSMFGFEIIDLLAIFLCLSILNFFFGQGAMKIFLVWVPTLAVAVVLKYGKRGKPEKYLVHWLRFQIRPGVLSAFAAATNEAPCRERSARVRAA